MAALLLLPATAFAAESVSVAGGVLTYTSGDGTVDAIWVTDGNKKRVAVTDFTSPSGTVGTGCTSTSANGAECTGATSLSLSTLDGDDNVRVFTALPATIRGGDGQDTLTGGPAADVIEGGAGDDKIEARDGVADTIDCGFGIDLALADAIDTVVNCNDPVPTADAPVGPAGEPDATPAPGDPAAPGSVPVDGQPAPTAPPAVPGDAGVIGPVSILPVTLAQEEIKVSRDGVATFELACAAFEAAGCAGVMDLDPVPRARRKGTPRAVAARRGRYGRSRFDVAAGAKGRVRMKLSRAARRRLGLSSGRKARAARRGRRVRAVVTVKQRGRAPARTRVKLRP
jgi:hypothetical protein